MFSLHFVREPSLTSVLSVGCFLEFIISCYILSIKMRGVGRKCGKFHSFLLIDFTSVNNLSL